MIIKMDFKDIKTESRPVPFWSWNERLDTEETRRQVNVMHEAGIGGFFMHARGGLQTEYMGEEWFDNVTAAADEGAKLGMEAWAYDENGWPSGFGSGAVNGLGVEYQQKYLRMDTDITNKENTIGVYNGYRFYYEVNPFYVDVLDGKVISEFIKRIYEPYYERYGNNFAGFFTDEPQISRNGIPWSFILPEEYEKAYGEELLPHLAGLFVKTCDYKHTRMRFWKLVTDLFSRNFMKQIYDWCCERGLGFTGHLVLEEDLLEQLTTNGACMPHYEYFTMPGMDWLGRGIRDCLTPIQVGSAAAQLGKKDVLSETFALCGHNVSFEELKRIYEWQMVHGITRLCQHLEGYSLRGIRKRDYPPAMYYQQPWWSEYKTFVDSMSRTGMILSEGKNTADTLLIHPQTSAWICFDNGKNEGLDELNAAFLHQVKLLESKHILFHLGDETLMERHGRVEDGCLVIGEMRYSRVILPEHTAFLESTEELLEEYEQSGGVITTAEEIEANGIIDNADITYTMRAYDGYSVHYFVNTSDKAQSAVITRGSKRIDIADGEIYPFGGEYTFAPFDSLMLIEDGTEREAVPSKELQPLDISGEWEVAECSENMITLDFCDYYFDNELQQENGYVLNIMERACALERPVDIRMVFGADAEYIPEDLCIVIETPEKFRIKVNGKDISTQPSGYIIDKAFKKLPAADAFVPGHNTIELEIHFEQSAEVYETLKKGRIFESEKNKLTYDTEIEPIYLSGSFGVRMDGEFEELERRAFRFRGAFTLTEPPKTVTLHNIERQGYAFFAGSLKLKKMIAAGDGAYKLQFDKYGINAVGISVNGNEAGSVLWNPAEADVSELIRQGENEVELTLKNNLRNMLGPHHLKEGETYFAAPSSFYAEPCIWNDNAAEQWDSGYCFVHTGLMLE